MKFGESIWQCRRADAGGNREISLFEAPEEIRLAPREFSVQPASGYSDIMAYGEDITLYQNAIAQPYEVWHGRIAVGDRFYLDGARPTADDMHDARAMNANYVVDSVRNQNFAVKIVFKKRTGI